MKLLGTAFVLLLLSRNIWQATTPEELAIAIEKAAKYGRSNVVPIFIENGVQVPPGLVWSACIRFGCFLSN